MHDDKQIWLALESASLKTYFEQQEDKLDFLVQEGGTNLRYYKVLSRTIPIIPTMSPLFTKLPITHTPR